MIMGLVLGGSVAGGYRSLSPGRDPLCQEGSIHEGGLWMYIGDFDAGEENSI